MPAQRRRGGRQSRDYGGSAGYQRAMQHIAEARQLTAELGGTDEDVKRYFFSLSSVQLRPILAEYERRHGASARQYAEEALPRWRNGKTAMSGMVASRLFALLPPHMPLADKYRLTESLWKHVGPSSRKAIRIGADATDEAVIDAIRSHIVAVVTGYTIPPALEQRFIWLASGDVQVKQQLLNHFRDAERDLVVDSARLRIPIMLSSAFGPNRTLVQTYTETFKVGKHELRVFADRDAEGVTLEDWSVPKASRPGSMAGRSDSSSSDWTWLWWAVPAAIILIAILQQGD